MDKDSAKRLVSETLQNSFNKERFVYFAKNLLNVIDEEKAFHARGYIPEIFKDYIKTYERIGTYTDPGSKKIDILIVYLQKETSLERARSAQRNFVARYLKDRGEKDSGLIAFVSPNDEWRFSFVKMEYKFVETPKGNIKAKEDFTPARRYSFLVGKNENSHTAQSRLVPILLDDENNPTLKELEDVFSIEKVTKEFFEKYRDLFLWAKETLDEVVKKDSKIKKDFEAKGVDTIDFAKKLLGQIVFLYFLQKKGWFGVERDAAWGTGPKNFLRQLFEGMHGKYKNFFNDILEPLFYEALATPDRTDDFYSHFNCKIPFLNGGLFDPINSYDWVHTDIILPNDLFSNENKTKEGDVGNGILDIFDRYNFTVKEDEPLEKEVAVDPEMLGKVFENLLEVKDRKSKGTYYTPREIVHYMCEQSLINYLATELEGKANKEDIEALIKHGESVGENEARVEKKGEETDTYYYKLPESIRKYAKLIDEKLANIKVCDPAIGSGAFPVGMMHEIVKTRHTLSSYIKSKNRTIYDFKRDCIQNSLYGVDIDPGAVEIAKLRLWLSLVVDEDDIKQIKPLPNLDYKIVCGNSLLGVEKNLFNSHLFSELEELKPLLFNETSPKKKQQHKKQIDELISKITNGHKDFDFEVYFSEVFHEKKGFDIVIANPPYVSIANLPKETNNILLKQRYETFSKGADIYCLFYEKGMNLLHANGILSYISSNRFCFTNYGVGLRKYLSQKNIIELINFNAINVFESANVGSIVTFIQNNKPSDKNIFVNEIKSELNLDIISTGGKKVARSFYHESQWSFDETGSHSLKQKIESKGVPFNEWNGITINRGITTGANNIFIIDEFKRKELIKQDPKSKKILIPVLRGANIKRYSISNPDQYLIFTYTNIKIQNYPAVYKYLSKNRVELEEVYEAKHGQKKWYELRKCSYYNKFSMKKLVWSRLSNRNAFSISVNGEFTVDSSSFAVGDNIEYLSAILNSKVVLFYFKLGSVIWGKDGIKWFGKYFDNIPIPDVPPEKQKPIVQIVSQILTAKQKDPGVDTSALEQQIDEMVYKLYGLTEEEIEIVGGEKR